MRISSSPIDQVQIGIVRSGNPGRAAAVRHSVCIRPGFRSRFARLRHRIPVPENFSVLGASGFQKSRDVRLIVGHAGDETVLHHQGRHADVIAELVIGYFQVPNLPSGARIQTDEVRIGRTEIQPVLVHRDTPLSDHVARTLALEVPDLPARPRVHRPYVVRDREVQDSVHHEGGRFDGLLVCLERPCHGQRPGVALIDL